MSLFCIIILMVEFRSAVIAEWFYVTVLYNYTNGGISFRSLLSQYGGTVSQLSITIVGWNGFVPQFVVIAGWYYVTVLYIIIMVTMEWLHFTLCHDRMDLVCSSIHSHNGMVPVLYIAIMGWFQFYR